jgi:hypothetical protein
MIRSIPTYAALLCFASFTATPMLRAQSEPATIPTVLGAALIGGFGEIGGQGPHFFVGRTPAGWPAALVTPSGATTVGGVAFGPMRMTVYRYPRSADPIASYTTVLSRAGFKPFLTGTNDAGFVSRRREATMFCGDAGSLGIVELDSTVTTRTLVASLVTGGNSAPCATMSSTPSARSKEPLAIPPLHAPRGVAVRPGSRGWSDGSMELSAQLDTTLSADAILAHYSAQLTGTGWKALGAPSRGEGIAVQQLSTRDASGAEWRGAVFVITVGDRRDVMLRMARGEIVNRER